MRSYLHLPKAGMALAIVVFLLTCPSLLPAADQTAERTMRQLIEEDWLRRSAGPVSTASDAAGACDGIKDGKYGFHTGQEPNPWWQVDLGRSQDIARIVVYNRLDYPPGLHNADRLHILTSDDGKHWTLRHDQQGRHFGGIHGAPPLDVSFADKKVRARFVRLLLPSTNPIFFHLDEVEIYGPGPKASNLALGRPADQSSLSPWSTAKATGQKTYATASHIESGRRLAAHLGQAGVNVAPLLRQLDDAARRLERLSAHAPEEAQRDLYLQVCWIVRRLVLSNPLLNFQTLLFVKRFTQETYPDVCLDHMPWVSRPGGDICLLHFPSNQNGGLASLADPARLSERTSPLRVQPLLQRALGPGHVHGMDLWWDAGRVVFGYARAQSDQPPKGWLDRMESYRLRRTEEPTHLFEIGIDGKNLRPLTSGEWSDLDPTYLPNGDIAFVSERCGTSLQCNEYDKDETSCNLYVMHPDGSGIRRLSANKDGDYLPHCLDNGLIGYTRWEYHERSWAFIQSLWVIRPDGTYADAIFKQHLVNPWSLEDVRSIPGSPKLVAIAAGHHTLAVGPLVVIDPTVGINDPKGIRIVTPQVKPPEGGMDGVSVAEGGVQDPAGYYATPWPLSEKFFLAAYSPSSQTTEPAGYGLYLVDVFGNRELLYRDPDISSFIPIPLRPVRAAHHSGHDRSQGQIRPVLGAERRSRLRWDQTGADRLYSHRRADRLALRQPARRPALRRGSSLRRSRGRSEEPAELDAGAHFGRRAGGGRRQHAVPSPGRHRGLLSAAGQGAARITTHALLYQLSTGGSPRLRGLSRNPGDGSRPLVLWRRTSWSAEY